MFAKLGHAVAHHPWWVIAAWVVAAALIVPFAPALEVNSDQTSFLPDSYESVKADEVAAAAFPRAQGSSAIFVARREDRGELTRADQSKVATIAGELGDARIPGVLAVVSGPEQVSPNGRVQLVQVAFSGDSRDERVQDAVGALRERAAPLFAGTGLVAGLTGDAAIVVDRADAYSSGELIVGVATVVLILVLLTAVFRSPTAALVPLLVVGLVFLIANALIAVVANSLDFEVADTLTSLLIVVLFGIGTDYILFLLFRFRERLREGEPARDAVAHAVARVGEPIGSAALTVAVAFAALLLAKLGLFSSMAPGLIIAVLVAVLAALTLVPAILALLGPRIFWPSKAWQKAPEATRYRGLGEWVAAHPWNAAISSGVALLALAASALHYTADYDTLSSLPADTESAQAFEDLRSGFPAGALNPTQVYVTGDEPLGVEDLRPIGDALRGVDGIASVAPPSLSPDGRTALIAASLEPSPFANEALDLAEGPLRDAAHAAAGQVGAQALVGGQTAALADMRDAVNGDMLLIFPVAAGMIFLILLLLLRSVLAPLTLMIAVALGFAATLGFAVIVYQGIADESGLNFTLPMFLYVFVVAIATDYNILLTARLREEFLEGRSAREGAALAIEHAGPTVASAGVILAGTFAALILTGIGQLVQLGSSIAFGVLLAAFLIAPIWVTSRATVLGRWMWWPGNHPAHPPAEAPTGSHTKSTAPTRRPTEP